MKYLFPLIGVTFIIAAFFTDPAAKTDDGYSLRYFMLIMGVFFAAWPFLIRCFLRGRGKRMQQQKAYFIAHGIPATATVVSAARTGVMINHVPQYNFHLNLKTSDGRHFEVSEKKTVDPMEAINLRPGSTLPAYMDPQKEEKIFICWREAQKR